MTTIITRLYSDLAAAQTVAAALAKDGHEADSIHIITDGAEAGKAAMKAARVSPVAAAAYAKAMTSGQALLVVQAPFNPVGMARSAMKVVGLHPSVDVGLADENGYIREVAMTRVSDNLLTKHPLLMSNPFARPSHGHMLGSDPLIKSRKSTSAMRGGGNMSKMFWPMKLVTTGRKASSAISGGWTMSGMFGIPLLSRRF